VYVYLTLRDECLKLRSILIIDVRGLNLNDNMSLASGLGTYDVTILRCDRHNQVLKDVD
jgi:hypothetical protein